MHGERMAVTLQKQWLATSVASFKTITFKLQEKIGLNIQLWTSDWERQLQVLKSDD